MAQHPLLTSPYTRRAILLSALGAVSARALLPAALPIQADVAQPLTGKIPAMTEAIRSFGFELFGALAGPAVTTNILISPTSMATLLAMLLNGARGSTAQALTTVLKLGGSDLSTINTQVATLFATLNQLDTRVQLEIADSLWTQQGAVFNPAFVNALHTYYRASVASVDFRAQATVGRVNKWVADATHGKIDHILDHFPSNTLMALINAVYFKAPWTKTFDKSLTVPGPFTLLSGKQVTVPLMSQEQSVPYYKGEGFQAISLPYASGSWSMVILLPDEGRSLKSLQTTLNARSCNSLLTGLQPQYGAIKLPRFSITYGVENLKSILSALGMGIAFNDMADFSAASSTASALSQVTHATLIDVDEAGTTAAAVSGAVAVMTAVRQMQFTFVVNRPFICAIHEKSTGTDLFLGAIVNPLGT